jgi:DNA polymerase elongation subunit (family B)
MYKSGCPIHVKGAIIYNYLLKDKGLTDKYEPVHRGQKIKFCYLRTPNILGEHVISTPGTLPPEFDLDQMVDYDTQFEKAFLDPIKNILDVIGWKTERRNTLESFFL